MLIEDPIKVFALVMMSFALQGILNYVILRPLMTGIGVIAQLCGVYGDSSFRFDRVYLYTSAINNFSQVCLLTVTTHAFCTHPQLWSLSCFR